MVYLSMGVYSSKGRGRSRVPTTGRLAAGRRRLARPMMLQCALEAERRLAEHRGRDGV